MPLAVTNILPSIILNLFRHKAVNQLKKIKQPTGEQINLNTKMASDAQ